MKFYKYILMCIFLTNCASSKRYLTPEDNIITYVKPYNSGSLVKLKNMRNVFFFPKKYFVGDTVQIYFIHKYK